MDHSPHAPASVSAPGPEEEVAEERCNLWALLPQLGLLPNTKQRLRRLISGFGLIGTFSTLLLVVSFLLLFLQQYHSPTSSSASSSSSSASAVFYFLSWFLPPYGSTANGSSASGATEMLPQLSPSQCDPFDGSWEKDDRPPYYLPGSCPFLDDDFNCHKNGRPDSGFLQWRWQPPGCSIPRLNATDFLSRLRGKKLVFVGDSLNRNMWESLVCILSNSIRDKNKVYEISRRKNFKTSSFYSFKFEDYQCSVDYVRSTFLVREIYQKHLNGSEDEKLRLDILDETTSTYRDADIIVFNTGHWWTHEKTSRGINYYQEGDHVYPVLKVMEAFKKALATWARWVDMNINPNKTQVVFRGYSPIHFRGGRWNSGGQCHKESEPIMITSYRPKYPSKMKALEQILKTMKTPVIYLNISRLTSYRKDGHPSIYRKIYNSVAEQIAAEKSQDCSHWCLPGVPDTWNELLYASLLKIGQGTWKL